MIDAPLVKMFRSGDRKEVFIIPSFSIENPDCEHLVQMMDDYQNIVNELAEYLRDIT